MRLGIRRKLIGTLMLVGLLPLVISLAVILLGGAAIQLREIRGRYEDTSAICADQISNTILHEEMEKLVMVTRLPRVEDFVRQHSAPAPADGAIPQPTAEDTALDRRWPALKAADPELKAVLENEAALRLELISQVDTHRRHVQLTNNRGQLIAADSKTDDYFQADEDWWQAAYDHGRGRLYVSSIATSQGGVGKFEPGERVVEIAVPVYQTENGKQQLIGILKDELSVSWLLRALRDIPAAKHLDAHTQLVDLDRKPEQMVVYTAGDVPESPAARKSLDFLLAHKDGPRVSTFRLFTAGIVIGWTPVGINDNLRNSSAQLFPSARAPNWVVVVSQSSDAAINPVYGLATIVAVIGFGLILVLFVMGVAISNREIIMPILRLREATAAVGRGELNVRVLAGDAGDSKDKAFRADELGELARDFDEMTRQLQKNINQLARSNEAKRRFMELAGHELRTPVTYLLGVCQLAQKQLQTLQAMATDGIPEDAASIALAAKNAAAISSALTKIAAKTERLTRIIDNLLKLVGNDQFTTRMNKTPVDIRALLLQVAADHRPFIAERRLQLEVDVSESLPTLEADRDKLEDALTNLLSNAIRFSPEGSRVRLAAHLVVGDMLEILVEDSGPGIPPAEMTNLFEPFYTGEDVLHHSSNERGLGLGLAIVRRFIELHGGIVKAKNLTGQNPGGPVTGTQFQILLPLPKSDGEALAPPAIPTPPAS